MSGGLARYDTRVVISTMMLVAIMAANWLVYAIRRALDLRHSNRERNNLQAETPDRDYVWECMSYYGWEQYDPEISQLLESSFEAQQEVKFETKHKTKMQYFKKS